MKKFIICLLMLLCLCGCKKGDKVDYKQKVVDFNNGLTQYVLEAEMEIKKSEGEICFDIEVCYLQPNYYKVVMQNKANNNIQVMVKNDDGVFVITPSLNKQFKFNSDWPLNSSHAYLLQSIVQDIISDDTTIVEEVSDTFSITSKTNNKTNANMKTQKTTFNKKNYYPVSNVVFDEANNPLVTVNFTKFDAKPNLSLSNFNVEQINATIRLEMAEGEVIADINNCVPTFMPDGFELSRSVVETDFTVFTYNDGVETYIISCIVTQDSDILTVSREFNDFVLLDCGYGFVNNNVLSFYKGNLMVSIYNSNFDLAEAISIANSFK